MFFERKVNTLKKRLNQAFFYFLSYKQSSYSFTYDGQFAAMGEFCVFGVMRYLGKKKPPQN